MKSMVKYSYNDVADWFLVKGKGEISPKKLQKLVYYAYAWVLMTIWRKSPYFSEGMDSLSLGLVESYFLYALYFWSLIYLSTTSLLMLPREPR